MVFGFVFIILQSKNVFLILFLILLICLIIGIQLLFTILHVSRLHKFVSTENRGNIMAVNNLISRFLAAFMLISSNLFITQLGLAKFFCIMFMLFVIFGLFVMYNTYKIEEKV